MLHSEVLPRELQVPSIAVLLVFLAWVVSLIRSQRLALRDSLLWLLSTIGALVLTAWPAVLVRGAHTIGIQVPANAIFAVGLLYLAVNVLSVTIFVSGNAQRTRRLAQECAILRAEIEALRIETIARAEARTTEDARGSPSGAGVVPIGK